MAGVFHSELVAGTAKQGTRPLFPPCSGWAEPHDQDGLRPRSKGAMKGSGGVSRHSGRVGPCHRFRPFAKSSFSTRRISRSSSRGIDAGGPRERRLADISHELPRLLGLRLGQAIMRHISVGDAHGLRASSFHMEVCKRMRRHACWSRISPTLGGVPAPA